ncbi:MAG: hypothetical protein EOP92_41100, partial [Lysobacteraceae bacterium]
MTAWSRAVALWLALSCAACASLSDRQREQAASIAQAARSQVVDCSQANACAADSALHGLG